MIGCAGWQQSLDVKINKRRVLHGATIDESCVREGKHIYLGEVMRVPQFGGDVKLKLWIVLNSIIPEANLQ